MIPFACAVMWFLEACTVCGSLSLGWVGALFSPARGGGNGN